jgi:hypothetical protein
MSDQGNAPESDDAPHPPGTMLALIDRYVRDPAADVDKLERLFALQERMLAKEAETAFNMAMNLAQEEIQPVARTAENKSTGSFFAKLEHVDAEIRPIYLRHGFSLSYRDAPPIVPGNIRIECRCAHVGGHTELYGREAAPDTLGPKGSPTKTALHGGLSTETTLKRYLACGIFNVVFKDMDDDGAGGYIDDAQLAHLHVLIGQVKALDPKRDELAFCTYMKIETLPSLPQRDYRKATSALEEAFAKLSKNPPVADRPEGSSVIPPERDGHDVPPQASRPSGRLKPGMR